jgi:hypothetical protein
MAEKRAFICAAPEEHGCWVGFIAALDARQVKKKQAKRPY